MNRLHPRVLIIWIAHVLVVGAVAGGIAAVADAVFGFSWWVGPMTAGVVVVLGATHAVLRYRRWGYEVREDELYLERGVITEVRTVVPLVRIQHVDSRRGPLERSLGLASTVVYTAGSRGADVRIPGLSTDGSRELQERLKRLAILSEQEDAV